MDTTELEREFLAFCIKAEKPPAECLAALNNACLMSESDNPIHVPSFEFWPLCEKAMNPVYNDSGTTRQ